MQSLFLPVILLLVFLLPPYLLLITIVRRQKRIGWSTKSAYQSATFVAAILASIGNTLFVIWNLRDIDIARLDGDWPTVAALLISWTCLCATIAIRCFKRRRRVVQ